MHFLTYTPLSKGSTETEGSSLRINLTIGIFLGYILSFLFISLLIGEFDWEFLKAVFIGGLLGCALLFLLFRKKESKRA
ncbi:MAG: hypothetical protein ACI35R_00870 [Bacillus sp. (in: firmicutes)]